MDSERTNETRAPKQQRVLEDARQVAREGRPLPELMPLRVGGLTLKEAGVASFHCRQGHPIPSEHQYALVRRRDAAFLELDVAGVCQHCRCAVPAVLRVHSDDARLDCWIKGQGWRFYRLVEARPTWWDLWGWMRRLVRSLT